MKSITTDQLIVDHLPKLDEEQKKAVLQIVQVFAENNRGAARITDNIPKANLRKPTKAELKEKYRRMLFAPKNKKDS